VQALAAGGALLRQSDAYPDWHETFLTSGPQFSPHAYQSEASHWHPEISRQASVSTGRSPSQLSSLEQRTSRSRTPEPQVLLHAPHEPVTQAHPPAPWQGLDLAGPSPEQASPMQLVVLVSIPGPHVELQADHVPTVQLQLEVE